MTVKSMGMTPLINSLQTNTNSANNFCKWFKKCHPVGVNFTAAIVWTPDPSGRVRKGLGNNLAPKYLAGMPSLLNPASFIFRPSTQLVRYYSNFQNFYVLPYIHFLSLVELVG